MLNNYIENLKDEIIKSTQELIRIPSVYNSSNNPCMPFGENANKVKIVPLNDLTDESDNSHDWGFYLYSHIVGITKSPAFTIYYSDGFEIIMQWFPNFITRDFISFKLNARGTIHNNLSATKVREMIMRNDIDGLKDAVPDCVLENVTLIRHFIEAFKDV